MAKYDYGGGCPCGLYRECPPECEHYQGKHNMDDEIFDFGFTAMSEKEIEMPVIEDAKREEEQVKEMERRLEKLHAAILPLLDNLRKTPESEYIKWPNRAEKIDDFKTHLKKIVDGDV